MNRAVLVFALILAGCGQGAAAPAGVQHGSYGAASGPNPNMVALNAHYDRQSANRPEADYVPPFLYYPDAPRPGAAPAPAQRNTPSQAVVAQGNSPRRT